MPEHPAPNAPLVVLPREVGQLPLAASLVGEKAARLSELVVLKARVPRFGVLSVAAFDALTSQPEPARLLAAARADEAFDEARCLGHGDALVHALLAAPLDATLAAALEELLASFGDDDHLAVRPSPLGAAHERAPLAGAFDTHLFVRRGEDAALAVRHCLASAFHPSVLAARYAAGLDPLGTRLGVIVQRMVNSEVSGALCTIDPSAGSQAATRLVLSATVHGER